MAARKLIPRKCTLCEKVISIEQSRKTLKAYQVPLCPFHAEGTLDTEPTPEEVNEAIKITKEWLCG